MKICYIWVEKFRNFENLGLNLSSSVKFKYDIIDNILAQNFNEDLPSNFFGESIKDVTGIIGKNGSGKSNALELICKALKGGKSDINSPFFIITEENKKYICYHNFKSKIPPRSDLKIELEEYPGKINPLKVVFFSNVFDERRNDFNSDVSDISVNNLSSRNFFVARNKRLSDFQKQINFIQSKYFNSLEIELPTKIIISNKIWLPKYNFSSQREMYSNNYEKINEIRKNFRLRVRELIPQNKFIQTIKYGFFFDIYDKIIRDYRRRGGYTTELINEFNLFIKDISFNGYTDEFTDELIEFVEKKIYLLDQEQFDLFSFYNEEEHSSFNNTKRPLIIEQLEFLKDLKFLFSNLNIEATNENSRNRIAENFIIDYSSKSSIKIINDFIRLFESSNYIDVNWLGISSGHKAYLNLFSSIFEEIRNSRTQNLLLCIDEGDLYLHPKWQIEFFSKLITVLPKIYSGSTQLVLTSHSPFLLSDLPKQNITILDDQFLNSTFNGIDLKLNTFGGNLYDLYSEPFFLGNRRTSDFAYDKIKELIESAENKKFSITEKNELLKLSNLVGDEIIQFRINKLLKND